MTFMANHRTQVVGWWTCSSPPNSDVHQRIPNYPSCSLMIPGMNPQFGQRESFKMTRWGTRCHVDSKCPWSAFDNTEVSLLFGGITFFASSGYHPKVQPKGTGLAWAHSFCREAQPWPWTALRPALSPTARTVPSCPWQP